MTIYFKVMKNLILVSALVCTFEKALHGGCACGRDPSSPVFYTPPSTGSGMGDPSQEVIGFEPELLGIASEKGQTTIYVEVSAWRNDNYFTFYFKSTDRGSTWTRTQRVISTIRPPNHGQIRSATHPNVIYKQEKGSKYLRSDDGGKHWKKLQVNIDGKSSEQFAAEISGTNRSYVELTLAAIHPRDANIVFGSFTVYVPSESDPDVYEHMYAVPGLYISRDGGESWFVFATQLMDTVTGFRPSQPVFGISSSNPQVMIGYSPAGLIKTSDGGRTWVPVGQQSELEAYVDIGAPLVAFATGQIPVWKKLSVHQIEFHPKNHQIVFLETNKGIYRTDDGGETWCLLDLGLPKREGSEPLEATNSLALNPDDEKEIFVGTEFGIFRSGDAGCHFEKVFPTPETEKLLVGLTRKAAARSKDQKRTR